MGNLSLLIPSYDDRRILDILSELKDYPREKLEIVIQDGGSPKELISQMQSHLNESDRLIIEKDKGIFDAINTGISNCLNSYILTIGTDDFITAKSLDNILHTIESDNKKIYFTPVRMVDPNTLKLVSYWPL